MKRIYSILSPFRIVAVLLLLVAIFFINANVPEGFLLIAGIGIFIIAAALFLIDFLLKAFFKNIEKVKLTEALLLLIIVITFYFKMR